MGRKLRSVMSLVLRRVLRVGRIEQVLEAELAQGAFTVPFAVPFAVHECVVGVAVVRLRVGLDACVWREWKRNGRRAAGER
jgi:hypothetical protein